MAEGEKRPVKIIPPYPLAMVICDAIWQDPTTQKKTLLGCFSSVVARQLPAAVPMICVYVALTDASGDIPIELTLVDANEENPPLFTGKVVVKFSDRRAIVDCSFVMQNLRFPEAGEYRFQLRAGGEHVIERRILVIRPEETGHERKE